MCGLWGPNLNKNKYDMNNGKRIYNLMVLKGKCLKYSHELMLESCSRFDFPSEFLGSNFFIAMSDAIDNLLFFFLNDEVSASLENRGPLGDILDCSINEHRAVGDFEYILYSYKDIQELFNNRTDFIIGSYFLDFTVSSFSVFEKWVCKAYEEVRKRKPSKSGKVKNLKKLLNQYNNTNESQESEREEILQKIMNSCSTYVSSAEKIDFVISMLSEHYSRCKVRDREIIKMYRSKRNTIHNLGIHDHESLEPINIRGIDIMLLQGNPSYTEDYNSNIYICDELVEIYKAMIDNLELSSAVSFIEQ
jgi:hypothetical protein